MKRVPPQSLTWRVDVEPWQQIEHAGFGAEVGELRTFARWYSLEELIADPDADPPAWLLDAIRAIEADS